MPSVAPICAVYSPILATHGAVIHWCATFEPRSEWQKGPQTGWHCTYLTSTHWHGNPAAFSWRCHFPTSARELYMRASSRGGFPLTDSRGRAAMDGADGPRGGAGVWFHRFDEQDTWHHYVLTLKINKYTQEGVAVLLTCELFRFFFLLPSQMRWKRIHAQWLNLTGK